MGSPKLETQRLGGAGRAGHGKAHAVRTASDHVYPGFRVYGLWLSRVSGFRAGALET